MVIVYTAEFMASTVVKRLTIGSYIQTVALVVEGIEEERERMVPLLTTTTHLHLPWKGSLESSRSMYSTYNNIRNSNKGSLISSSTHNPSNS